MFQSKKPNSSRGVRQARKSYKCVTRYAVFTCVKYAHKTFLISVVSVVPLKGLQAPCLFPKVIVHCYFESSSEQLSLALLTKISLFYEITSHLTYSWKSHFYTIFGEKWPSLLLIDFMAGTFRFPENLFSIFASCQPWPYKPIVELFLIRQVMCSLYN